MASLLETLNCVNERKTFYILPIYNGKNSIYGDNKLVNTENITQNFPYSVFDNMENMKKQQEFELETGSAYESHSGRHVTVLRPKP
jgi:hypothetical protein